MDKLVGLERAFMPPVYLGEGKSLFDVEQGAHYTVPIDLADETVDVFSDVFIGTILPKHIDEAVETLTEKEQGVLALRLGLASPEGTSYRVNAYNMVTDSTSKEKLDGNEGLTLEDIARTFSLSRERIRQIELKALRKLRHPRINLKHLRPGYIED